MPGSSGKSILVILCLCALPGSPERPAPGSEAEPLRVRAAAPPGTYYVGQAIEVQVAVVAAGERPRLVAPRIEAAEVTPVGTALRPLAVSAIGDVVAEVNAYLYGYRIVPRRAGMLDVPPFVARLGGRSGASPRFRIEIHRLPTARPRGFLGGVGAFEVEADARPRVLRVGQELEYRLRLTGPGARGSTHPPEPGFDRVPLGLRVELLPGEAVADPPARTFRYRLRPTRAGEATLPPVAVAAFDPASGHFQTKLAGAVPIRVVDVPRLDPAALDYGSPAAPSAARKVPPGRVAAAGIAAVVTVGLGWAVVLRWRRADLGRRARRWARGLEAEEDAAEVGRRITDGLADYLHRAIGRPPGVLTPEEARRAIAWLAGDPDLADRAGRLIAECDRVRYAGRGASAEELVRRAQELIRALRRRPPGAKMEGSEGEAGRDRERHPGP
ncbi:MAG TPA: hypothetical protein VF590_25080 [Isosphaeraceae bacterium]